LAAVNHKNIVAFLGSEETPKAIYLVMEFCEGDLERYLKGEHRIQ
jgi:serine/threonine protein kinase